MLALSRRIVVSILVMLGAVAVVAMGAPGASAGPAGSANPPARVQHSNVGVIPGSVAPAGSTPGTRRAAAYADGGVLNYGDAAFFGSPKSVSLNAPVVGMDRTPSGDGYWLSAADGGVFSYGGAGFYGSSGSVPLQAPVVGMAATPAGRGYWQVALDGGVFSYGDAHFYGSTGSIRLNQPVVGMAATPGGRGYWLVAADGGIFTFGDAHFYGSTGSVRLNQPIVGMAATPSGDGYWLVAADGGIFTFGTARFVGSTGAASIPASVAGMARTASGGGYWLAGSDGSVYPFGDAVGYGSNASVTPTQPIAGITPTADARGYWLLEPDAFPTSFVHPGGHSAIVAAAAGQIQGDPFTGSFCNPYGPCEPWCALFAAWAWQQGGVPIPRYAFVGDIYSWAAAHTSVFGVGTAPRPGDAVLYGTGPQDISTAVHMGIVAQVWPDGAIVTIEGDSGPGAFGHYNVTINGPFLPSQSATYNGVGIFAFARP